MKAKDFNMTQEELEAYCDSLSATELKKFQLDAKLNDIKNWHKSYIFSFINFVLSVCGAIVYSSDKVLLITGIIASVWFLFYTRYSYVCKQGDILMYKMLVIWFNQNKIL